jgi:hypothetical protein
VENTEQAVLKCSSWWGGFLRMTFMDIAEVAQTVIVQSLTKTIHTTLAVYLVIHLTLKDLSISYYRGGAY